MPCFDERTVEKRINETPDVKRLGGSMMLGKRSPVAKRWLGEDLRFGKRGHDVNACAPVRFDKSDSHIGFKEVQQSLTLVYKNCLIA